MKQKAKFLLFDLDDTLVHSQLAYRQALSKIGLDMNGRAYVEARKEVKDRLGPGNPSARNRLMYFKKMAEVAGAFTPARVLEVMNAYESELERLLREQWQALGREALFQTLCQNFTCAIVTNENLRTQLIKTRAFGDQQFFSNIITSEEVGCEKPDAEIFVYAMERLGATPGQCVMVGDDWGNDVVPAVTLGMRAIWSNEFNTEASPGTLAGVTSIANLNELIEVL